MGRQQAQEHEGVAVISRNDTNDAEVVAHISEVLQKYLTMPAEEYANYRSSAHDISKIALWENLIEYYYEAYRKAHDRAISRKQPGQPTKEPTTRPPASSSHSRPTRRRGHGLWSNVSFPSSFTARRALEEPVVVLDAGGLRTVRVHRSRTLGQMRKESDRFLDRLTHSRILALEKDELFLENWMRSIRGSRTT